MKETNYLVHERCLTNLDDALWFRTADQAYRYIVGYLDPDVTRDTWLDPWASANYTVEVRPRGNDHDQQAQKTDHLDRNEP
ncbi:MAG: hypothetical protein ISN29_02985 [Gammaproteobacteria bacterium AqS3]|nr:hypothetical protein [Gammaproteobacteria bacterium AqS3]